MEAATKWTEDKLDGVHLVLCDSTEYLFTDFSFPYQCLRTGETKFQYCDGYSDGKEYLLKEYASEWQDAVHRELDKLGTVNTPPGERERRHLPEYITDHITVERERYSDYWYGYNRCGYEVGFGAIVYRSEAQRHGHRAVTVPWKYQDQYGPELERLIDAISEATSNAHEWINERIERDLRVWLGESAAAAIEDFLRGVNA
tara:strand:+ start:36479 stop:37081 length:603 start_codon:yes stop_codon:yes gene_type:complete